MSIFANKYDGMDSQGRHSQGGVAILAALGVLVILGLLTSAFAAHMRLQSAMSSLESKEFKAHYLAMAGIQDAIARIKADAVGTDSYADGWWVGNSPKPVALGEGRYTLKVTDESTRLNISTATPQMLSGLLAGDKEATAAVAEFRAVDLPFVIEDLAGANIPADSFSRLIDLGTALGDGKVNINTAGADVIAVLPGMDSDTAQFVVDYRRGPDGTDATDDDHIFVKPIDILKVPGLSIVRTAPAIPFIKVGTEVFRVESVGSILRGERTVANKKIIVFLGRDENRNVKIISWESS
jgi:type II secretory pathway component PulK